MKNNRELIQLIKQICREKEIDPDVLFTGIESALLSAARKMYPSSENLVARLNQENGDINLSKVLTVVEKVNDPTTQINLNEAQEISPDIKIDDIVEIKMEMEDFGRIAAQTAKHVIMQKVNEAQRDHIYNDFKNKRGELVSGTFNRKEKGNFIIDMGKAEAFIPEKEIIPYEAFKRGDRLKAYVIDICKSSNKGHQIILSRTHPNFVLKLFEFEVPEIPAKIVTIKGVVREPGERTKIAVYTPNKEVDPVGACVGIKGSRVQSIVRELKGEKIDIINWSNDPATLIHNALSPAEIMDIRFNKKENSVRLIVPDKYLSLAIGKKGQNARLASKLTGWKIDIKSETEFEHERRKAKIKLEQARMDIETIPGIGPSMAAKLLELGIRSVKELADIDINKITPIAGIGRVKAEQIIKHAKEWLSRGGEKG